MFVPGEAVKKFKFVWVVIELVLFFVVAGLIGFFWALMLVMLSSVCGVMLVKHEGSAMLQQIHLKIQRGEQPNNEMVKVMAICFAGMLLIVPGFLTSLVGILILLPVWRNKVVNWLIEKKYFTSHQRNAKTTAANDEKGRVIEGESWREDE